MRLGGAYPRSMDMLRRAATVIPGAHHLSGRALLEEEDRAPHYFERGKGCRVWDLDGNEYIDFLLAYGCHVLGYADERVDRAAVKQLGRGSLLSMNHPLHVAFAEKLLACFPSAAMCTFFKTGSEATTAALRIARAFTKRRRVVRCGYHGWHDWCVPLEGFVPDGLADQVLQFSADALEGLTAHFRRYPGEIAAVILAPEMVLPFRGEVVHSIARIAREGGALFILDEVKTAFRIPPGSVQERIGLTPDLTTVSKALGNGWPIAATLGTRPVMNTASGMFLSATFHGDTASMVAAMTTLDILEQSPVAEELWRKGQILIAGLNDLARSYDLPAEAYGEPLPPMPFFRFVHPDAAINAALRATFYEEMFGRGILLHPRHLWFICESHTDEDISTALTAADASMAIVRERWRHLLVPPVGHLAFR